MLETRRHDGDVFRRRRCECGGAPFVTRESLCDRMPAEVTKASLARLHARRKPAQALTILDWSRNAEK